MSGLLVLRDSIRDFLRKYDEVTTPVIKFIFSLILFMSINSMFGYEELFNRGIVVFLLSVICSLVSNSFIVIIASAVVLVNAFSVSTDSGLIFAIMFVLMYCMYIRLFPKWSWILLLTPVLCVLNLQYLIPLVVAILAGPVGIIPSAFGIIIYYFSVYTQDIYDMMLAGDENVEGYSYYIDSFTDNKLMFLLIIVFSVVILVSALIYRMSFNYSWYVAIGAGAIFEIIFFLIGGTVLDVKIGFGSLFLGVLIGALLTLLVSACKHIVDYSRKESVQFEDDDYYYYVKAIPKFKVAAKKVDVRKVTSTESIYENADEEVKRPARAHSDNKQQPNVRQQVNDRAQANVRQQGAARSQGALRPQAGTARQQSVATKQSNNRNTSGNRQPGTSASASTGPQHNNDRF